MQSIDSNNTIKSLKPFFGINFLYKFFSYIKIFKVSSATYHQKNKKMLHKKLMKSNKKKKKQKNREYGCKKN